MSRPRIIPLGAIARGVAAGAVGTLAMDLVWYSRYRRGGGEDRFTDWEFSASTKSFDDAGAPAQIGKRIVEGLFHTELPPESAAFTNNVVHWATGSQWGAVYGVAAGSAAAANPALGLLLGAAAWGTSYVVMPLAKLYKPIWEYDAKTLAKDLSAHLVFGLATAGAFRALSRGRPSR